MDQKKSISKNHVCSYFDDIINGTKIIFSNILLDKKLYENISVYNISYKTPTGPNHHVLGSIKKMDLLYLLMVESNL